MAIKAFLRKTWTKLFLRKMPPGAIHAHIWAWATGTIDPKVAPELERIRKEFDLQEVYVMHGIAFKKDGKTHVVSGPIGIGKSTLLEEKVRHEGAEGIDDGLVLIGRKSDGKPIAISTGLYDRLQVMNRPQQWLRRITGYTNPFSEAMSPKQRIRALKFDHRISQLSGILARLFVKRERSPFKPQAFPIDAITLIGHPDDRMKPRVITPKNEVKKTSQAALADVFPKQVRMKKATSTWLTQNETQDVRRQGKR